MDKIIEVSGLKKAYGSVEAVRGIDFYAARGELLAFLGPNGAGKSTTVDLLTTILRPDGGKVRIAGHELGRDDGQIRRAIGVVFQEHLLDPLLTVEENLRVRGGFYSLPRAELLSAIETAARAADVTGFMKRPYGKLSGGQKRRADIARALIHTPKILFLDEPTTGLDPQTRRSVWDCVRALQRDKGVTVFLTTHYMEEAAEADYVIVIDMGKIAAKGAPAQLREMYAEDALKLTPADDGALIAALNQMGISYGRVAGRVVVKLKRSMDALPILDACRGHITGFEVASGTMDDAFIGITGREMRA
jgi:multidrug/hemolysin transport system ATP-binding protein